MVEWIEKMFEKNRWMVGQTGKNRRMVGGIEKWMARWIDAIEESLDGQEKIEQWLDGYTHGWMDRKIDAWFDGYIILMYGQKKIGEQLEG